MAEHVAAAIGTLAGDPDKKPAWRPLGAIDRRVVGVLIEKAKTTPDAYPLSLNALLAGCNQKSNRDPEMDLTEGQVEESLDRLRGLGAVLEVQTTSGRVLRYRHQTYEWLGVDKAELAVMAELLLRGAQTEGELRGRVARMEPIADLNALRPILNALKAKGLVVALSPEGRGHVVTHALYEPQEFVRIRAQFGPESDRPTYSATSGEAAAGGERIAATPWTGPTAQAVRGAAAEPALAASRQVEELRIELAQLRQDFDQLAASHGRLAEEVHELKQALGA